MDLNNVEKALEKTENYLSNQMHKQITEKLRIIKPSIVEKNKEMWNIIWDYYVII
jgi:hypothetical protein